MDGKHNRPGDATRAADSKTRNASTIADDQAGDGAALLDRTHDTLTRYVVLPSPQTAVAVTLWIAATHAVPAWQHAIRLAIGSPEKRCG